jgi:hypothetical protein
VPDLTSWGEGVEVSKSNYATTEPEGCPIQIGTTPQGARIKHCGFRTVNLSNSIGGELLCDRTFQRMLHNFHSKKSLAVRWTGFDSWIAKKVREHLRRAGLDHHHDLVHGVRERVDQVLRRALVVADVQVR